MHHALIFTFLTLLLLTITTPLHAQPASDSPLTTAQFNEQFETRSLQIIDNMDKGDRKVILSHLKDELAAQMGKANPTPSQLRLENAVDLIKDASGSIPQIHNANALAFYRLKYRLELDEILQSSLFLRNSPDQIEKQFDAFCQALRTKANAGAIKDPINEATWQELFSQLNKKLQSISNRTRSPHLKQPWPDSLTPGLVDKAVVVINRLVTDPACKSQRTNKPGDPEFNSAFFSHAVYQLHVLILQTTLTDRRTRDAAFDALCKRVEQFNNDAAPARQQLHTLFQQYTKDLEAWSEKNSQEVHAKIRARIQPPQTQLAPQSAPATQPAASEPTSAI